MEKNFNDLGVAPLIVKAIEEMGFVSPTEVQSEVIPHVLLGKDLIVMAKTGSGKTGAFGIPVIQSIDPQVQGPQALILTPTRELAVQVDEEIRKMSNHMKTYTTALYGQHNMAIEIQALKKGKSIITGTPGRVQDHILKHTLNTKNIKFLVLDEADRMLDMGFIDQVVKIIKSLPRNRVTMLFSATMPSEIQRICKEYMKQPLTIELGSDTKTVDAIKQVYYRVQHSEKRLQLNRLLKVEQPDSCMVFCNTRHSVDKVCEYLLDKGYHAKALHGAKAQTSRMRTIDKFKDNSIQVLVATDVAARGLHVDDLSLVINYDVPVEKDSYIHRIGRTGRAGNGGKAISLVTPDDIMTLYELEEHVGALIEECETPTEAYANECAANAEGKWVNIKPPVREKPSQDKSSQSKPYQSKPYQGKPYQGKTGESKPYQGKTGGSKPYQGKSREGKPYEGKPLEQTVEHKPHRVKEHKPVVEQVIEKILIPEAIQTPEIKKRPSIVNKLKKLISLKNK